MSVETVPVTDHQQEVQPAAPSEVSESFFARSTAFLKRTAGRVALTGAMAIGMAPVVQAANEAPAEAASFTYTVTGTGGDGVWLHGDPGLGDQGDLIKIMPEGTRFMADCYVNDTPVGPRNNPAWLHGTDETGATGYFTDFYSSSHWDRNNTLEQQGLPICGQIREEDNSRRPPEDTIFSAPYNHETAVNWARTHAKDTPPYNASCTWFVSNALWAGGFPQTVGWTSEGGHGRDSWPSSYRPGSIAAWAVDPLYGHLVTNYPQTEEIVLDSQRFQSNSVPEAAIGDVMFYDWEGDGELDHAAIVTSIANGSYPEVTEWSVYDGRRPTPYTERGWTWSEKDKKWLQKKHSGVVAILLHIDATRIGGF